MIATAIAILIRSALLARFLLHAPLVALPFAISEGLVVAFTIRAMIAGKIDSSAAGALVPIFYGAPLLFRATAAPTLFWPVLLIGGCAVAIVRLDLLERVTIGAPALITIKTDGLYRFCRHPIAATEILMAVSWPLAFPSFRNFNVCCICLIAIVGAAALEERFLRRSSREYREYANRVRSLFIPRRA